jgi:tetratricopeptide (TPR) repeat protein
MEYDDFVIQILPGQDSGYGVVVQSPAGSGKGRFKVPSGLGAATLGTLALGSRDLRPATSVASPRSAREIGDLLFQALFTDRVGNLFYKNLGRIESSGRGLRIRLRIDPDLGHVMALPWELLHIADTDDFLSADRYFSVVRSLDVMRSVVSAARAGRRRILAVSLSPEGYDDLDLAKERRTLAAAAKDADVVFRENLGRKELRAVLHKGGFHVLHLMGHGTFDASLATGFLLFAGANGSPEPVSGQDLAEEIKGCRELRLVVLNACHSARAAEGNGVHPFAGVASALVQGGVPAVVAMRSRISDQAAIAFTEAFYQQLAAGEEIDTAVAEGRLAIQPKKGEGGEWDLPVLFLPREDVTLPGPRSFVKALSLSLTLLFLVLGGGMIYGRSYKAIGLNEKGALLAQQGHLTEARGLLLEALRLDSGYAAPDSTLAIIAEQQGRYGEALQYARAAVEKSPNQAAYQYNLGRLLARIGDEREAIRVLRRALELEPCHAAAQNELGNLYLGLDLPADARRAIEAGLRCDHTTGLSARGPLLKNLGRAALKEGKPAEAVRDLTEALVLYDREDRRDSWEPTYWLAEAYARQGRQDLACQRLQDFARLVPMGTQKARSLAQQQRCNGVF